MSTEKVSENSDKQTDGFVEAPLVPNYTASLKISEY